MTAYPSTDCGWARFRFVFFAAGGDRLGLGQLLGLEVERVWPTFTFKREDKPASPGFRRSLRVRATILPCSLATSCTSAKRVSWKLIVTVSPWRETLMFFKSAGITNATGSVVGLASTCTGGGANSWSHGRGGVGHKLFNRLVRSQGDGFCPVGIAVFWQHRPIRAVKKPAGRSRHPRFFWSGGSNELSAAASSPSDRQRAHLGFAVLPQQRDLGLRRGASALEDRLVGDPSLRRAGNREISTKRSSGPKSDVSIGTCSNSEDVSS